MPRSTPSDGHRIYQLYYYLCACLAMEHRPDGSPVSAAISNRLSDKSDFRKIVSRIFQHDASAPQELDLGSFGRLTTGEVVTMLARLQDHLRQAYQEHEKPYTQVLSTGDILTVLAKVVELTPDERNLLGLGISGDGLTLLQRALLILQTVGALENYELVFRLYKAAIGLEFATADPPLQNLEKVDELIEKTVRQALDYLPERSPRQRNHESPSPSSADTIRELILKAQREVRRLLARSGNQEGGSMGRTGVDSYIQHYFQPRFVVKLAQTVVANERLTSQFPVYLKRVTIESAGPLPFADKAFESRDQRLLDDSGPYPALLHPSLRKVDQYAALERSNQLPGPGDYELASQEANRVVAEFYVKVPEPYQAVVPHIFRQISSGEGERIDFSLSSTGIGGALSHVIKVINMALLWDIPCLKEYFSIAHDVTSTQTIVRDNVASPIWAHSLVKLCRKTSVGQAIQGSGANGLQAYEQFAFADPMGHGDYCGFDFFSAQGQASLQARLQAIRSTGVLPDRYLQDLCRQIEYRLALKGAWANLQGYPFSSLAMIGVIERDILAPGVGEAGSPGEGCEVQGEQCQGDRPLTKSDPYIFFDACLSIAEALLDEGTYRRACRYLNRLRVLDEFVQRETAIAQPAETSTHSGVEIFSGALLVRYLLCWANYYYLYDPDDHDPDYLPPNCTPDINREGLIRRAWQVLEQAQQHIERRLRKYVVINEVSQGTFHPHYNLLGRMAFLRAKLLLFFSRYVPAEKEYLATDVMVGQQRTPASIHWGRLHLAEKARLYAAADGNGELYACYAALQSWMYLVTAYADPKCLSLSLSYSRAPFSLQSRAELLNWAKTLRDHALISYAETGRQCYYQIKEKSGLPNESDHFGFYEIQKIKPIYEARGPQDPHLNPSAPQVLVLDMSLLCIRPEDIPKLSPNHPDRTIYLFGSNACYLFFARGMFLLCSDQRGEFDPSPMRELAQWNDKLHQAMRLLNMAWAIAEEGGHIQPSQDSTGYRITRDEASAVPDHAYTSADVNSIRDLYPRRVTEIADLGKVFSAACMVLRLYTLPDGERSPLLSDISRILHTLHGAHRLNQTLRHLMVDQQRYNGHLTSFCDRAKSILYDHRTRALNTPPPTSLTHCRDTLLAELFGTLMQ